MISHEGIERFNSRYPVENRLKWYVSEAKRLLKEKGYPENHYPPKPKNLDDGRIVGGMAAFPEGIAELYILQNFAEKALDAHKASDWDLFAQSFERVVQSRILAGMRDYESEKQSGIARRPRSMARTRGKQIWNDSEQSIAGNILFKRLEEEGFKDLNLKTVNNWPYQFRKELKQAK